MSVDRRYSEQEITRIFKQATKAQETAQRHLSDGEGLTLAELQEIGNEAGITSEFIARAAAAMDRTLPTPPPKTYLGSTVSVQRTVELPGALSDDQWDRLVVDLRETFNAAGAVGREGSLRQWRNGNLHVLVEPTESGHRLSFRTLNENLRMVMGTGLGFFLTGMLLILMLAVTGDFAVELANTIAVSAFAAAGLGGIGYAAYRLPRWAKLRGQQMEAIASRAAARMADPPATPLPASDSPAAMDLDLPVSTADVSLRKRSGPSRA